MGHPEENPQGEAALAPPTALAPLDLDTVPLSTREKAYDDVIEVHRASRLESLGEVSAVAEASLAGGPASESISPAVLPPAAALGLGETILRRGSTRVFARESIGAEELATIMATARAPLHVDFPSLVESYLIVNAVDGMAAGPTTIRATPELSNC